MKSENGRYGEVLPESSEFLLETGFSGGESELGDTESYVLTGLLGKTY